MKKMYKWCLLVFFCVLGISNVSAACTTEEMSQIRSEAVKVKPSYEKKTRVMGSDEFGMPDGTPPDADIDITVDYFEIYINNLTENLYITVYNDVTKETSTYTYNSSENGTVKFIWSNINEMVNYTIKVYSSKSTSCADTQLYQVDLKLPRYNNYSLENICTNASDFYLCREYVTTEEIDYVTFIKKVQAYLDGQVDDSGEEKKEEKKEDIKKDKKALFIAVSAIIIVTGVGVVIIVKKQRSKKNEKI